MEGEEIVDGGAGVADGLAKASEDCTAKRDP
jgi:hypothetical protein